MKVDQGLSIPRVRSKRDPLIGYGTGWGISLESEVVALQGQSVGYKIVTLKHHDFF